VFAALLGTGGCGTLAVAAVQAASSVAAVSRRLDSIEAKLDAWRDEQHESKARVGELARDGEARASNARALDSRIDSLSRDLSRCRCPGSRLEVARSTEP
jgi:septation ring formation regulator EzrA